MNRITHTLSNSAAPHRGARAQPALKVLTSYDQLVRYGSLASNLAVSGLMAAAILPLAAAAPVFFAGSAVGYMAIKTVSGFIRYSGNNNLQSSGRYVPAQAHAAVRFFSSLAGRTPPVLERVTDEDAPAKAGICTSYREPRITYTDALRRSMPSSSFNSVIGHEIGHLAYDNESICLGNELLAGAGRAMRFALIAGAVIGTIPATPALLGLAIAGPVLIKLASRFNNRNDEYINDRFAALAMGTPVAATRALRQRERHLKNQAEAQRNSAPSGPLDQALRNARTLHRKFNALHAPLTADHPSDARRRVALHGLRKNAVLKPGNEQFKAARSALY